jgi:hypothetical protein
MDTGCFRGTGRRDLVDEARHSDAAGQALRHFTIDIPESRAVCADVTARLVCSRRRSSPHRSGSGSNTPCNLRCCFRASGEVEYPNHFAIQIE